MARFRALSEHDDPAAAGGAHDIRNWKVRTGVDDQEVGRVHDVLLGEDARTRYLDVGLEGDRHILVPTGEANIDRSEQVVHISGLDRAGLSGIPEYQHRPDSITSDYTRSLNAAFNDAYADDRYYDRPDYASDWDTRAGREESGTLARLDELDDVDVASHDPDPRGWDVIGVDGERLGRVDHILGDTGAMKARYLTVELDEELARDRQILMPVGHVDLDPDHHRVLSRAVGRERVGSVPAYEGTGIDRDYETRLTNHYDRLYEGEREFEHPRYRSRSLDRE
jgi:hypothetical protein